MRFMYASTTIHAHPPYEKHDLPYRNSIIIVVIYLFAYHPLSSSPHGFSTVTSNPQIFPLTNRMMCPTITLSLSSPWSLETPSITTRCLCFGRRRSARMSFVHNVIKRTTWLSVGLCVCVRRPVMNGILSLVQYSAVKALIDGVTCTISC